MADEHASQGAADEDQTPPGAFSFEDATRPTPGAAPAVQGFGWSEATAPAARKDPAIEAGGLTDNAEASQVLPPTTTGFQRVVNQAFEGAKEGFGGNPVGTILSDHAQAKLDEIQRQGGWKGTAAQLASTLGTDIGTAGNILMGIGNAGFGAYQRGVQQIGAEAGQPAMGRDIAAIPESLMGMPTALHGVGDAAKMRALGIEHPPGTGAAIQADIAQAKQTAAEARAAREPPATPPPGAPIPTEIITPEQRAQAEEGVGPPGSETQAAPPPPVNNAPPPVNNPASPPASETPAAQPVQPAQPTRIRTVAQIQEQDGVSAAKAAQIQQEEIVANSRPITNEEREARAAGVANAGPRQAAQAPGPPQSETPANQASQPGSQTQAAPIAPEPQGNIDAQVRAMLDPQSTKDAVFVAAGSPMPTVPHGVIAVAKPDGTLLTTNPAKAQAFHQAPVADDTLMASLLGYPETKEQATASGAPRVVQGVDQQGNVQAEAATSPQGEAATQQAIAGQVPDGTVRTVTGQQALDERAARTNPASSFVMLTPDQLKVDPGRFQYKTSDEKGVTGALQGVTKWEPALANPITAWQSADGDMFVVNGHQRHYLATTAKAAGQPDVQMATRIFRQEDGYTPEFMKVLGAYQNIAEGSGSPLDAARVLRGKDSIPTEMVLPELPPRSAMVQQAQSLAKLSPNAFGMVDNGVVSPAYAAHVGELIADPREQEAALAMLAKAEPANAAQAKTIVQDIRNSGFLTGTQSGLFGDEDFAKSIFPERAKVLDGAMQSLRKTRGLYKAAVEGESELTATGNQLSTESNIREKANNDRVIELLQRAATTKGPISDALSAAAQDLAAGKPRAGVQSAFIAAVRKIIGSGEDPSLQPRALDGGAGSAEEAGPELGFGAAGRKAPLPPPSGPDLFGADRTSPPPKAPEPTIRNDARQEEMPGMGPSAVQAQAAADAKGPRADQLPADHGLFGRPETPQNAFGWEDAQHPPVSKFAHFGGDTFTDLLHTVPDRMGGNAAAAAWVAERGRATGHEHMAIVDNRTGEIVHAGTNGDPKTLRFDPRGDSSDPDTYSVHHNHPNDSSLSGADVGMLMWPAMREVAAHTHDGNSFVASLGEALRDRRTTDPEGFLAAARQMHELYVRARQYAISIVQPMLESLYQKNGKVTAEDVQALNRGALDLINHLMHGQGAINLTTTRELAQDIRNELTPKGAALLADRPAGTIQPAERPAGVHPAGGDRPVQGPSPDAGARGDGKGGPGTPGRDAGPAQPRLLEPRRPFKRRLPPRPADDYGEGSSRWVVRTRPDEWPVPANPKWFEVGRFESKAEAYDVANGHRNNHDVVAEVHEVPAGFEAPQNPLNLPNTPQFDALRDKAGIRRAIDEVKAIFAPTSLRGAKAMEGELREHGATKAQSYAQSAHALEKVRDAVDQLDKDAQIDFTDRMERGVAQASPELDQLATALRGQLDTWARRVQGLGKGYLTNAISDYMGHVWGNYREWAAGQPTTRTQLEMRAEAAAAGQGKTPLLGSKAFLKERTFGTQLEGINAGLVPVTYNPVDLQLLKIREMQKFYHGVTLSDEMKNSGIAQWVPAGQERAAYDAGLTQLDDRVFQPRLTGDANPAGFGRLEPGNWYASEPAARLFNNYMSQGLSGSTIFNGIRAAGNGLNMAQLGLSGFHATFVALDTMKSQVALGIQQLARGAMNGSLTDLGRGAASVAKGITPYSLYDTVKAGNKLRSAWLDPTNATPEWRDLARRLNEGGGRISMDQFYHSNAAGPLLKSLGDFKNPTSILDRAAQTFRDEPTVLRKAVAAPIKLAGRVLESISHPLMGWLVPRAKLGVFAKMAQDWQEAHPMATPEERSRAMIKAWDSVDNRLGQLVYDNLFWNKAMKDMAFITTRSVGWNLGTIRELGGGAIDGGKAALDIARGRKPEVTSRMAYTIAMPIVTALYGSILNYLATGHGPESTLDMFFPQTGTITPQGQPERRNIPGYEKDILEYAHAPVQTVLNKINPLAATAMELYHNQDYYGGIIHAPGENRAASYIDYLVNQSLPFSWRGFNRLNSEGASKMDQALSFWGFQPAPKSITQPEVGEGFQMRQDIKAYRRREREPGRYHIFTTPAADLDQ